MNNRNSLTSSTLLMYIGVAIVLFAILLALLQRYVASLITLASATLILSFVEEKRCSE